MVSVMLVVCRLSVFLSMCLFVLFVLCLTGLVNTICVGEVSVFSLKVMVLFLGCGGVLLASPCINCLPESMCVVFGIPVCV